MHKKQQDKIEDLTARMIRLETAFAMLHQQQPAARGRPRLPKKRSDD